MDVSELLRNPNIWPHQIDSYINSQKYIQEFIASKEDIGGALNRLPTGTGKSGIITLLARCCPTVSNVLILTPSESLRDQLLEDIDYDFFRTIEISNELFKRPISKFYPSDIKEKLPTFSKGNSILISTIQSLYDISKNDQQNFKKLRRITDLVIFDEGHREPAPEWAKVVRSFHKPIILFTATPYRNDKKRFEISDSHIYGFTHKDAVAGNYIRNISHHFLTEQAQHHKQFVEELIDFYENDLPKLKPKNVKIPRVIIHCRNHTDILNISEAISEKNYKVIGIHEQFIGPLRKDNGSEYLTLKKRVPNLKLIRKRLFEAEDAERLKKYEDDLAIFWVHQYKLLEGIDEFSFSVIANFSPMTNARMTIQQVGRVLRNREFAENTNAIFLSQVGSPDLKFWQGYQKYETEYENSSIMEILYYQEMFDGVSHVLPEFHYVGKEFKTRFDWYKRENIYGEINEDFKFYEHIKFKLSCHVFYNHGEIKLGKIEEELKEEWLSKEYDVRYEAEYPANGKMFILPYVKAQDSSTLLDMFLFNFKFGYLLCYITDKYLYFYDSNNSSSDFLLASFEPVHPEELKKLFPDESSSLRNITLRSTDIGNFIIRRQILTAASLNNTVADLVDYINFYSTAKGSSSTQELHSAQRYVGFTRARVSDLSTVSFNYEQYIQWLNVIDSILSDEEIEGSKFFDRYADFANPPEDTTPNNILIDFDEIEGEFQYKDEFPLDITLTCLDIKQDYFTIVVNISDSETKKYNVHIDFDSSRKKYYLDSASLVKDFTYYSSEGILNKNENLIRYLNREQCFRVIPSTPGFVYAHNLFFKPKLSITRPESKGSIQILPIFVPLVELDNVTSEKGRNCTQTTWESKSLFRLIDDLGADTVLNDYIGSLQYLICDDTGDNESCDFIGLEENPPRVVFIHCKYYTKQRKRSATAFQEICGQAIKNLIYLSPYTEKPPPNSHLWTKRWSAARVKGSMRRIRYYKDKKYDGNPELESKVLIELFQNTVRNTAARKEVYLVLGRGFNKKAFEDNIFSPSPDSVNMQMAYLLQSTWSNCGKIANDFKIFCS